MVLLDIQYDCVSVLLTSVTMVDGYTRIYTIFPWIAENTVFNIRPPRKNGIEPSLFRKGKEKIKKILKNVAGCVPSSTENRIEN